MSGRNVYERVRAAYGLDEDEALINLSSSPSSRSAAGRGQRRSGGVNSGDSFGVGPIAAGNNMPGIPAQMSNPAAGYYGSPWSVVTDSGTAYGGYNASGMHPQSPSSPSYSHNSLPSQTSSQFSHRPQHASNSLANNDQLNHAQFTNHPTQYYYNESTAQPAEASPPPPPAAHIEVAPLKNANSVRVPFDPEDQSDDEVVITTAYSRKVRSGEYAQPAAAVHEQPPPATPNNSAASQSTPKARKLSATAVPFCPQSTSTAVLEAGNPPKPLADIAGINGSPNDKAEVGQKYPGSRVSFCPWRLVSNYHLWFVGRQNSERIKPYFEKEALLKAQAWDFCYLWRPTLNEKDKQSQSTTNTPVGHVLLVPTHQFQHFMNRVNQTLGIQLIIPPGPAGEKFRVYFGQKKTPVPRFLGRADDEEAYNTIVRNMPAMDTRDSIDHLLPLNGRNYAEKVEKLLTEYGNNKMDLKNAKAEKNRVKRKMERENVGRQIKRAQRYLGLRPRAAEQVQLPSPGVIDLTQPPPYPLEEGVVLVSMDIESYEFNHNMLTEIGFGILDTRDIANVPPGVQCQGWFDRIEACHLRIQEHAAMVNRRHVTGNENNFNFGVSKFIKLADVLKVVTGILQPRLASGEPRKVVLVGHDIQSDIKMISQIGFIVTPETFLDVLDTQDIHQHFRMRSRQMGLKGVLNDLEIDHSFLHNGGNDAVYTLQAMLSLVIAKRQDSLRRQNERLESGFVLDADVVAQGWASGGEGSDGGHAGDKDDKAKPDERGIPEKKSTGVAAEEQSASSPRRLGEGLSAVLSTMALSDHTEDLIKL